MNKRLLLIIAFCFFLLLSKAQDSTYYFAFWEPVHTYQKAGVSQEGVFHYYYEKGVIKDSLLAYTKLYDSLGRITRFDDYNRNKKTSRWMYYYSGLLLDSIVREEAWVSGNILHRYDYNKYGYPLVEQAFYGNRKTMQLRYVYNTNNQLIQLYRQFGDDKEELTTEYVYRQDRLIQQINHFRKMHGGNRFSYLYSYNATTRTTTKFFEREPGDKRLIDCIRVYDADNRLVEKINPPLPKNSWLPPEIHPRREEYVEQYFYLSNGLLSERQVKINDRLVSLEKHVYVY